MAMVMVIVAAVAASTIVIVPGLASVDERNICHRVFSVMIRVASAQRSLLYEPCSSMGNACCYVNASLLAVHHERVSLQAAVTLSSVGWKLVSWDDDAGG